MRILLFLNKDFEANLAFNLLKQYLTRHEVWIFLSDQVGDPSKKPEALSRLEYFEKDFFFQQVAELAGSTNGVRDFDFFDSDFSTFPIESCSAPNAPKFLARMRNIHPDLVISIRYGRIFHEEFLAIPNRGVINLHSAILPAYRGILGTLHALEAGDEELGCTLHYIPNSGIDTGPIINYGRFKVARNRSLLWHVVQLYPLGCNLIVKVLKSLENGDSIPTIKQTHNEGRYFTVPTAGDLQNLALGGFKLITQQDYVELIFGLGVLKDRSEMRDQLVAQLVKSGLT